MRVDNKTAYDTRALHRLITAVHAWMAREIGHRAPTWRRLTCEVTYARNSDGWCTGVAYLKGIYMKIRLPKPGPRVRRHYVGSRQELLAGQGRWMEETVEQPPVLTASAANVMWHELMHIYGYGHDKIAKHPDTRFAWAAERYGGQVPLQAPKPAPAPADALSARLEHIKELEARWNTRLKRAQTHLQTLGSKRKRIERAIAKEQGAPSARRAPHRHAGADTSCASSATGSATTAQTLTPMAGSDGPSDDDALLRETRRTREHFAGEHIGHPQLRRCDPRRLRWPRAVRKRVRGMPTRPPLDRANVRELALSFDRAFRVRHAFDPAAGSGQGNP